MEKKKLRNSKKYHHVVSNSSPYFMTTPSKRHVKYFSDFEISKLIVKPDIKEKNNDIGNVFMKGIDYLNVINGNDCIF